ncbi:MAG: glutamate racemase [Flavobacteriales bacterium]|nr:glutamate racemase [Crocinitomicaceae bacterium]NBX79652.1 glutamate racemase [Flavobacteriales bacterium]NCA21888.1 glutamate racemase [Crocinitomicaceae bacterium]
MNKLSPIGVFDSGYGGLTVLSEIRKALPQYDYIYFGDNARAPYGNRSFDVVYEFTLEAVRFLFDNGCPLVILACNTASAKALRSIQQNDLPQIDAFKRVLGVIRPSTEEIEALTSSNHVGILGTNGTIQSESYVIELKKFAPDIQVVQHACPIWVPLIENNYHESIPGRMFVKEDVERLLAKDADIDTIILACTHYPILKDYIQELVGPKIKVVAQGPIVARKLEFYLVAHPDMENVISHGGTCAYFTTENKDVFNQKASQFLGIDINSEHVILT